MSQFRTQQKSMSATFIAVLVMMTTATALVTWWVTKSYYQDQKQKRFYRDLSTAIISAIVIVLPQWLLKLKARREFQLSQEKATPKTRTLKQKIEDAKNTLKKGFNQRKNIVFRSLHFWLN